MPQRRVAIGAHGAITEVGVEVSNEARRSLTAGRPAPPTIVTRAIIDTGASMSAVAPSIVDRLGLVPIGRKSLRALRVSAAPASARLFEVSLALTHIARAYLIERSVRVVEAHLPAAAYEVVIGHDILADYLLVYDGEAKTVTIAF